MTDSVIQLKCNCNNYPWGQQGSESLAARLCAATPGSDFTIDESKTYAEMWMGTYPEGDLPSRVLQTGELLQDVINANADALIGPAVLKKFGANLPFLPKVLCAGKALPLQVHPNIDLSKKLHEENPQQFTDPNHKPEIAIAITQFEAFAGWKPLERVETMLKLEPLRRFLPHDSEQDFKLSNATLKQVTYNMLKASDADVKNAQDGLGSIAAGERPKGEEYVWELLPRLQTQYETNDPGTLVALVCMNYMNIAPGECLYVPADGLHAWLSGTIIECMARSNNVLNAGFCPRADADSAKLFVQTLTFNPHNAADAYCPAKPFEGSRTSVVYAPPTNEFNVLKTTLQPTASEAIRAIQGPSVLWVTEGDGKFADDKGSEYKLAPGFIYFVGRGVEVKMEGAVSPLVCYRAYVE